MTKVNHHITDKDVILIKKDGTKKHGVIISAKTDELKFVNAAQEIEMIPKSDVEEIIITWREDRPAYQK